MNLTCLVHEALSYYFQGNLDNEETLTLYGSRAMEKIPV